MSAETANLTGYGPRVRLLFSGNADDFDVWETRFMAHLTTKGLKHAATTVMEIKKDSENKDIVVAKEPSDEEREKLYCEIVQYIDTTSLQLVMRDAMDDGTKAMEILRNHYKGTSKPRVLSMYTQLCSMQKLATETMTDYVIRVESLAANLRFAGEVISDELLIAMTIKGLPDSCENFVVVVTQSEKKYTFAEFKIALRNFCESNRSRNGDPETVMKVSTTNNSRYAARSQQGSNSHNNSRHTAKNQLCFICNKSGHFARSCRKNYCNKCKVRGHTDSRCKADNTKSDEKVNIVDTDSKHKNFAFVVGQETGKNDDDILVDTGATAHIINDKSLFTQFDKDFDGSSHSLSLADGRTCGGIAKGRGQIALKLRDSNGIVQTGTLDKVLYIPDFPTNIFSVSAALNSGAVATFYKSCGELRTPDDVVYNLEKRGKLYYLPVVRHDSVNSVKSVTVRELHRLMGHCNVRDLQQLPAVVDGIKLSDSSTDISCEVCCIGKQTRAAVPKQRERAKAPLELVFTDVAGPIAPQSINGDKYVIVFIDDYSGMMFHYFMKHKSDATEALRKFICDVSNVGRVKAIRSDNGGEYTADSFNQVMHDKGIKHEFTAPHTPQQCGVAERSWRSTFNAARCMLADSGMPKFLWPYAVATSGYTRNRCYQQKSHSTAYELFYGKRPNLQHMIPFGTDCFVYAEGNKSKLAARSTKGKFIGYAGDSPAYHVYSEQSVKASRNVHFITDREQVSSEGGQQQHTAPQLQSAHQPVKHEQYKNSSGSGVGSDSASSGAGHNNAHDYTSTKGTDDILSDSRSSDAGHNNACKNSNTSVTDENTSATVSRPHRETRIPSHLHDYDLTQVKAVDIVDENIDYCFHVAVTGIAPATYAEAICRPDSDKWKEAMDREMASLRDNETWELEQLPPDKTAVSGKWVYTHKLNREGGVERHKARYVARGFNQQYGSDYSETFAPTAKMSTVRALMQATVDNGWLLHQLDVKTAYLNAPIDYDIYVEQPRGYVEYDDNGKELYCLLKRSLYGLKQSGRLWNNTLHEFLLGNGFRRSNVDYCLYLHKGTDARVIVFVDDIILASPDDATLSALKSMFMGRFKMTDMGILDWFLGISIENDNACIRMSQNLYIEKLLEKFAMQDCHGVKSLGDMSMFRDDISDRLSCNKLYRSAIGALVYLMTCTRPDLSYIVTKLSQYLEKPTKAHWLAMKQVFRYSKETKDYELIFSKSCNVAETQIIGYCDADWGNDSDRRSTSGYCFMLSANSCVVSWKSKKQPTVALSTTEAEYMAVTEATKEALYIRALMSDIDGARYNVTKPVVLHEDNQGAISLVKNPTYHGRTKHIDIRYHFIREHFVKQDIELIYMPTEKMVADCLTKLVSKSKLEMFSTVLFGK